MKTKANHIEEMIRGMLESMKAEFDDGATVKPTVMTPVVSAAIRHFEAAMAKLEDWKNEVFRGEAPYDAAIEAQLKANFATFIELAQFLDGRIKAVDVQNGMPVQIRTARLLVTAKEKAQRTLDHWTSPSLSMASSLRTRNASDIRMTAALP